MTLQQHHLNLSLESVFKGDSWTMFVACLEQQLALPHLLPLPPFTLAFVLLLLRVSFQIKHTN